MRNDHPIAFTFNDALATADGELRKPSTSATPTKIANRGGPGAKPDFPLTDGKVQCSTCHDPHRNTQKFLLKNRLATGMPVQQTAWDNWTFNDGDQICLGCHTRLGKAWQQSAHANPQAANETYKTGPGALRDFPTGTQVWQAGCLNCHDTHAVAGSRRLLREGVSGALITLTPADLGYSAQMRTGDPSGESLNTKSATENTCFQCHSDGLGTPQRPEPVINTPGLTANEGVPNVAAEFARPYHMPIINADQGGAFAGNNVEKHEVTDNTGMETQIGLGYGVPANRHVECTDCHNPHRVVKADTFLGPNLPGGDTTRRTHVLARGVNGEYGNIASGVLRGAWGVEPSYTSAAQTTVTTTSAWLSLQENPTFTVKKGDPGGANALPIGSVGTNAAPYLTREYQLCFKCHSSYANGPNDTDFPLLKPNSGRGGTPSTGVVGENPAGSQSTLSNKMTRYTNVAAEFAVLATDPPSTGTHQGERENLGAKCNGGDCDPIGMGNTGNTGGSGQAATHNHRAWHPVIFPTGRDKTERSMTAGAGLTNIRAPWDQKMGSQTMHCTDCHGNPASYTVTTNPNAGGQTLNAVQGPHGSEQPYLLKGRWDTTLSLSGTRTDTNYLCIKCHQPQVGAGSSGYGGDHQEGENMNVACMFCHVAVPHGWKNKAFLVNGLCVGIEGKTDNSGNPITSGCVTFGDRMNEFTREPYYIGSRLRVGSWPRSGGWNPSACNGEDNMCGR